MKATHNEPKALLVARVSDIEQHKALPAQKKRLYEYAKRCRWVEKQDFDTLSSGMMQALRIVEFLGFSIINSL